MKTVVIANPRSQNGALGKRWPKIEPILRAELGELEVKQTAGPRDATRLAREAIAGGAERVVAVGGDGTIHEVANGFFTDGAAAKARLGVIPFGTGGDFRKTAELPLDIAAAARTIASGRPRAIDVGRLEYQAPDGQRASSVFVNIASFGIAGLVDEIINHSSKILGGKTSFLIATARAALRYKNQRVRLTFDQTGEPLELKIQNVAVANGKFFGGGMRIAPGAELDDGDFDVVAVGDFGTFEAARHFRKLYAGTHLSLDKVVHRRAKRVDAEPVDAKDHVLLDVDGEPLGTLPATFTLLPRALTIMVPGTP